MAILLYCVTQANENVSVTEGILDSVLQSHEFAGLRLYWSEIANPEACFADAELMKKSASQFQQVLRHMLSTITVLPFPFPTLLTDVAKIEDHLKARQQLYLSCFTDIW